MYLERFTLPIDREEAMIRDWGERNFMRIYEWKDVYPCGIFEPKQLREINFERVTILYGGNGSGKSTLLNLIARKLELRRIAPFNSSELFDAYAQACEYERGTDEDGNIMEIPEHSRIITSDDVFDYMLTVRVNNEDIRENREAAKDKWGELRFGETVKLRGIEDYEALRLQVLARRKSVSRKRFIRETAGQEARLNSNGETAIRYFEEHLGNDTLYCLDEPENSMAPAMQRELVRLLEESARYCGCQFILATHSPFLLAMRGARIYDLDSSPVEIRKWWELENTKEYYRFFMENRKYFEGAED